MGDLDLFERFLILRRFGTAVIGGGSVVVSNYCIARLVWWFKFGLKFAEVRLSHRASDYFWQTKILEKQKSCDN